MGEIDLFDLDAFKKKYSLDDIHKYIQRIENLTVLTVHIDIHL